MSDQYYIDDSWKSDYTDFSYQKNLGIEYIQEHATTDWTNLNSSDPGVTILDQICYALTELGYCNQFPIKDILTKADGTLKIDDQFYRPNEILTTSPVTLVDYQLYILDAVDNLYNVTIVAENQLGLNVYQVYLYASPYASKEQTDSLPKEVFFALNNARNLNELFLMPELLTEQKVSFKGTIEIQNENDLTTILDDMERDVRNYIFPEVTPETFGSWTDLSTDTIYNGPELNNGWIDPDSLGTNLETVLAIDIRSIFQQVENVISVTGFEFIPGTNNTSTTITGSVSGLISLDYESSIDNGDLTFVCNGKDITKKVVLKDLNSPDNFVGNQTNAVLQLSDTVEPEYPTGTYRDINSFYSIQNTFPEIFGIGDNEVSENASAAQIAQSKQLKGYLTLFDQVLANQFSQLANVDKLFSFKNSLTGTPSDLDNFIAAQDVLDKNSQMLPSSNEPLLVEKLITRYKRSKNDERAQYPTPYPVPFLRFSPTYFYQSVYDTPHIRPLLKGYESFDFELSNETSNEAKKQRWTDYKLDPYNPYMHGLMQIMEDEDTSLTRRNSMLDFVLAQNGESPYIIDSLITGSIYTGNSLKDLVIFKSLYLQNLGLLSYNRLKGYNYLAADTVSFKVPDIPLKLDEYIYAGDSTDFIFNSSKIDAIEKLENRDFMNYSGFELKLSLLFGLRTLYRDYIVQPDKIKVIEPGRDSTELEPIVPIIPNLFLRKNQALWMIRQRKGLFYIETSLLAKCLGDDTELENYWIFNFDTLTVFPNYIETLQTNEFQTRLSLFEEASLPPNVVNKVLYADGPQMALLIFSFTFWHNAMTYNWIIKSELEILEALVKEIEEHVSPPLSDLLILAIDFIELYILTHETEDKDFFRKESAILLINILNTLKASTIA